MSFLFRKMDDIFEQFYRLQSRRDVAELLGVTYKSLCYFLYKKRPENLYYSFEIHKKNGSIRRIVAPQAPLREIQRKLLRVLTQVYRPKSCVYGFVEKRSVLDNATKHVARKIILNIDLRDFFDHIHFGRVRGLFISPPYSLGEEAATTIAQLVCYNGKLPQGAPTSPIISNMICRSLDNELMRLAKDNGCSYSRYADDITFSTYKKTFNKTIAYMDDGNVRIGEALKGIIEHNSFEINWAKTKMQSSYNRQEVTGLTVNEFPNVRRQFILQIRAILHSCEKYGIEKSVRTYVNKGLCKNNIILEYVNNEQYNSNVKNWFAQVLVGKINYVKQIKGADSYTFYALAKKCNLIFEDELFDLSPFTRIEKCIENCVFIVEYENLDNGTIIQGSAFYYPNVGIITSYHVTENDEQFKVYRYNKYSDEYIGTIGNKINLLCSDKSIDYALYNDEFDVDNQFTFNLGDSKVLKIGDEVYIVGYPNYIKGASYYKEQCKITSLKPYMGACLYTVSGRVVHGTSGGLVLNSSYEIVGIIKAGVVSFDETDSTENQGFIPIHLVQDHINNNG